MAQNETKAATLNKMVEEIEDYAILLLDTQGNIENWNKGAEKIKGYTATEIVGQNFRLFYTAEDQVAKRHLHLLQIAAEKGRARDIGWRVRKDATKFWADVTITAIHNDVGDIIGFTKVTRDLTTLKDAEEQLRASEERYARMIEEVQDYAIILLDTEGNIENWNKGAEKIKGYTADEIIGQTFRVFYTDTDRQNKKPETLLGMAIKDGRASDEGWRVRKDGSLFWALVVITALHNDADEVIGFSKVTKDQTDKKKAEDAQAKYMQQLEKRREETEQLTYIASHDLQEPLRTINNFATLFQERYGHLVDKDGQHFIDVITRAGSRMRELVKGLLDYSVLGVNKEMEVVNLDEVVKEIIADLNTNITATGTTVRVDALPAIKGYRIELRQLFQNLITNAIKFRKQDTPPHIDITVKKEGDMYVFSIADNGIGMDTIYIDRIFQMFQRLHSRDQYPGTGIGLAYAKKIAEMHNGNIWVTSQRNEGSTFYVSLQA